MTDSIFREGGPLRIKRRTGSNEVTMQLSLPADEHGMVARQCGSPSCEPGYFKVKPGTGITENQDLAYCPYCRRPSSPDDFLTKAQLQYAKDTLVNEAAAGVERMIEGALGLGPGRRKRLGGGVLAMELSLTPSGRRAVARPVEEELRRDVRCDACTLEHAVFGLATWCPDCGRDVFDLHLQAELQVSREVLAASEERGRALGPRVAAKDIENTLEDVVSVFEAVLKLLVRRRMATDGRAPDDIDRFLERVIRAQFQNPEVAARLLREHFATDLWNGTGDDTPALLANVFAKRHPITHNLGIVDRKYLERVQADELKGRDVRVSAQEVEQAIAAMYSVLCGLRKQFFGHQD